MNSLLDKALVKPLFKGWVFVRKHPFLTIILGAFLFLLPPLGILTYALGSKAAALLGRPFGASGAKLADLVESWLAKVASPPWSWILPGVAALIFPPLGVLFLFWTVADFFKGERVTTKGTSNIATPAPTAAETSTSSNGSPFDINTPDFSIDTFA
jgi:hypothetical protein